jgi:hypothetical protein
VPKPLLPCTVEVAWVMTVVALIIIIGDARVDIMADPQAVTPSFRRRTAPQTKVCCRENPCHLTADRRM